MSSPDFSALVARHRTYFRTGATRSAQWREGQLTALRAMMTDRAEDFYAAQDDAAHLVAAGAEGGEDAGPFRSILNGGLFLDHRATHRPQEHCGRFYHDRVHPRHA
jgi:hypothetical protein